MSKKIGRIVSLFLALALTVTTVLSNYTSKEVKAAATVDYQVAIGESKTVSYTDHWTVSNQSAKSSDSKVATAKVSGTNVTITGVAEGTATITVDYKYKSFDGSKKSEKKEIVVNVTKHALGEELAHLFVNYEGTFSLVKDGKEVAKVTINKNNFDINKVNFTAAYKDGTPFEFKLTDKEKISNGYYVEGNMYKGTEKDPIYYTLTYPVTYKIGKDSYTATLKQTINYFEQSNICVSNPRGIDFKLNVVQNITTHSVKFMNENTEITTVAVDDGAEAKYSGTTPTKAEDASNTYTFAGWVDASGNKLDLTSVHQDTVAYASYTATAKNYTVEFVDANGKTLQKITTYHYNDTITAPTVESYSDNTYNYTFANWTPDFSATCTGNAKYTAVMTKTKRTYNISFVVNGETVSNEPYEAETKAKDIVVPTVADIVTNEKTYKFTGWNKKITDVNASETYIAQYDKGTDRTYTVKFVQPDGTEISSKSYKYNETITVPSGVTYNGDKTFYTYTFKGWDNTVSTKCVGDVTYIAEYEKSIEIGFYEYTTPVKVRADFFDMDSIQGRDSKLFTAIGNKVTIKEADFDKYPSLIPALEDAYKNNASGKRGTTDNDKIYAIVNEVISLAGSTSDVVDCFYVVKLENSGWHIDGGNYIDYSVVFTDDKGEKISSKNTYHYGDTVEVPADPTKVADNTYTYTFAGWTPDVVNTVVGDATYEATFNKDYINYTVTFKNYDGSVISSKSTYHYGDTVVVPADPTKAADNTYTYKFAGWNETVSRTVMGNAEYTATYTNEYINYTVTFKDYDGSIISENKTYHYGDTVVVPADPTRKADNNNTYVFKDWGKDVSKTVVGNDEYTANYTSTAIDYTINFYDEDGTLISGNTTYHYGDTVVVPADPTKAADNTYTYKFAGWDETVSSTVKGDANYYATYSKEYINYTVTFKNYDGSVISENKTYHYGDTVVVPADPTRKADNNNTYVFKDWGKDVSKTVVGNDEYTANYTSTAIDYVIVFYDEDKTVISRQTLNYGDAVVVPADPTKAADNTYTYKFAKWDKEVSKTVVGNAEYYATYDSEYINYTVIFKDYDGSEISSKTTYHYGDVVEVPANPTKAADETYTYAFAGWGKDVSKTVVGDDEYTANYTSTAIDYTVNFYDEDGSVISSNTTYHYGDTVVVPADPTKAADETYTYTFAKWNEEVSETVVGNADYYATYANEYINYTVTFKDYDGTVITFIDTYHYGDVIEVPENVTRASDNENDYEFIGWNEDVAEAVNGNLEYIAEYTSTKIVYTITFLDEDETLITQLYLNYGDTVVAPAAPVKETVNNVVKTFAAWTPEIVDVDGNATYTATYTTKTVKEPEVESDETVVDGSKDDLNNDSVVVIDNLDKNHSDDNSETDKKPKKKGEVEADQDVSTGFVSTGVYIALLGLGAVAITALFAKKKTQKDNQ